jgi:hypothetical protein
MAGTATGAAGSPRGVQTVTKTRGGVSRGARGSDSTVPSTQSLASHVFDFLMKAQSAVFAVMVGSLLFQSALLHAFRSAFFAIASPAQNWACEHPRS